MSVDLRERLEQLATRAPEPADTADLWRRGRVRQLRRTAAAVAATLVLALVAGVGVATLWTKIPDAVPTDEPARLVLPDRFFTPSVWLPGTDDKGPIGPLVAIMGAERKDWLGRSSNGLVGVGTDGTYRFLDLPEVTPYPDPWEFALSSDGRWLAYAYTGRPGGDPLMQEGGVDPYVGIAVYDTVTGRVLRHPIESEHGLSNDGLAWSGGVVWFSIWPYSDGGDASQGSSSTWQAELRWNPVTGDETLLSDFRESMTLALAGPAPQGLVTRASRDRRGFAVTDEDQVRGYVRTDRYLTSQAVSPDGRRIVGTFDRTPSTSGSERLPLVVGRMPDLPARNPIAMRDVDAVAWQVLGWRDNSHVVATGRLARRDLPGVFAVDVDTGDAELVSTFDTGFWAPNIIVASDVWAAPTVHAHEPGRPWDPRLTAGVIAIMVGCLVGAVVILRRRRVGP
ncbi:MAG: PD40 domain-containing protein [Nocardioidaceae bacterium]|nr:PD40 domain-containing protein [Nocardioidaceae bacterium]